MGNFDYANKVASEMGKWLQNFGLLSTVESNRSASYTKPASFWTSSIRPIMNRLESCDLSGVSVLKNITYR